MAPTPWGAAPEPERDAGLWDQATSSRGGRWAVGLAIAAVCVLLAGSGVLLAASARADRAGGSTSAAPAAPATPGANGKANGNGKSNAGGKAKATPDPTDTDGSADNGAGDLNALPGRLGGVAHGEITRPLASGGTQTLLVQNGTVSAASDTSVTVMSSDGYAETYAVSAATTVRGPAKAAGLAVGTAVSVVAAKDGKQALLLATKGKPS
ncbi:MAG: hypothetical protein ABIW80_10240 [Lapillicoccus sp.]